ncbi:MAG: hypothetical protein ACYC0J_10500, partial [Gammaproteobacteria bacterium]
LMIRGRHLFGRDAISPREKEIVRCANVTAEKMFSKRFEEPLKDNWDIPVEQITRELVEADVVKAVKQKYGRK